MHLNKTKPTLLATSIAKYTSSNSRQVSETFKSLLTSCGLSWLLVNEICKVSQVLGHLDTGLTALHFKFGSVSGGVLWRRSSNLGIECSAY